jgi:hypothetical protein
MAPSAFSLAGRSNEVEDEFERVVDGPHLLACEMASVLAKRTDIDSAHHFAHHTRRFLAEDDLGMETRSRSRGRGRTDDDRRQREQIICLDHDGKTPAALYVTAASGDHDRVDVTADHAAAP